MSTFMNWFYGTFLGGLYFEFLLWLDRRRDKPTRYLTPKEMASVIRESTKLYAGTQQIKNKINTLVNSRSADEYHRILCEIEDLAVLAENDNKQLAEYSKILRSAYVKKGLKDISSNTEMAKMIDQRIQDTKELWDHQSKRQLLREIRKAGQNGDTQLLNKLQMEFKNKYGRSNTRSR